MVCERRFKTLTVNSSNVKEPTEFTGATKTHTTMETQTEEPVVTVNAHVNSGVEVFLQTAIAQISKTGKPNEPFVKARVIFDGGAQRSYINQKLVDQLELPTVNTEKLKISTFGEKAQEVKICNLVELNISNPQNNFKTTLNAFSVPFICDKLKTQNVRMAKERFTHLSNIKFSDELPPGSEMEVDILIGADYMWAFMQSQTKRGEFHEPVAVLTKLGWVISGPMKMECKEKLSSINFVTTHILKVSQLQDYHMEDNLSTQLEKFWSLDSIGIQEKDTVHEAFLKNIEFKDERYSVKLPFKEHHDILPDNYENAVLRLKSNLKRLNNQPEVLQEYDSIIQEQLKAGIIERVNAYEIPEVGKTHYIPHHPVIRKQTLSTKLRMVYDASNRLNRNSPSLNDILYVGPLLTPLILDILLRI